MVFNGLYAPKLLIILAPSGHLGVLVFFVLSGFVIASSNRNGLTKQNIATYLKKRFVRIYPIYLISIVTILVTTANNYGAEYILLNILLLQPLFTPAFIENGPAWSLNFEVLYYLLFIPFSFFRINPLLILATSVIIALANYGLYPNLHTPIISSYLFGLSFWIGGVYIAKHSVIEERKIDYKKVLSALFLLLSVDRLLAKSGLPELPDTIAYFFFHKHLLYPPVELGKILNTYRDLAFLPCCILLVLVFSNRKVKYQKLLTFIVHIPLIYSILVTIFEIVTHKPQENMGSFAINIGYYLVSVVLPFLNMALLTKVAKKILHFGTWLGSISYAMYIIHCPIIFALGRITAFNNTPLSFFVKLVVFGVVLIGLSYWLERIFQPFIKKLAGFNASPQVGATNKL